MGGGVGAFGDLSVEGIRQGSGGRGAYGGFLVVFGRVRLLSPCLIGVGGAPSFVLSGIDSRVQGGNRGYGG